MIETVMTALTAYIGTNIDDIFINTLLFANAETKRQIRAVIVGKYLGIGALTVVSLLGALGLGMLPQKYIALLGILPIALGIKEIVTYLRRQSADDTAAPSSGGHILEAALVTAANGADNIGVYIPLFAGSSPKQLIAVAAVFAIMTALWCLLGKKLADLPALKRFLIKYKHIIIPTVLISLGILILTKAI